MQPSRLFPRARLAPAWAATLTFALPGCCFSDTDALPELASLAPVSPVGSAHEATLDEAARAIEAGDYAGGLALADQVVASLGAAPDPALEAGARGLRGSALMALGRQDEAIPELQRSRALSARIGDEEGVLVTTHTLASALDYAGRGEEAEPLFRELVTRRRELHGAESVEVGRALVNLGVCLELQGRMAEAGVELREAVRILEAARGTGDAAFEAALNSLGNERRDARDLEGAIDLYRRALIAREARLGPTHPELGITLHNLAVTALDLGRHDEALAAIDRALAVRRGVLPPEHPWLVEDEALRATILETAPR